MPTISAYDSFFRRYKKFLALHPNLKKKILEKLALLKSEPYAPVLRFHKLTGRLEEFYAITIDYDYRIIIDPDFDNDIFYLVDIGTHDEVY
ncbi:MAG: hypothetical protein BWY90_00118 [Deltaproteobacteria bacterium ADurb.BinA014]|nr:MAG: hypothetical protein BWY90_00118 [Deltaproteobacteria bacterium ADurb.BinA014]